MKNDLTKAEFFSLYSLNKRLYIWVAGKCHVLSFTRFMRLADLIFSIDGDGKDYSIQGNKVRELTNE